LFASWKILQLANLVILILPRKHFYALMGPFIVAFIKSKLRAALDDGLVGMTPMSEDVAGEKEGRRTRRKNGVYFKKGAVYE
jgi:hypothetical protein